MSTPGSDYDRDRRLAYQMVHFLEESKKNRPEKSDDLEAAASHISAAFGFDRQCPETFKAESYYPTGLKDIFSAGAESLRASVYNEKFEKASQVPNFEAFVETVSKKGYFVDAEEGSVEYIKRHAKVVKKFQDKVESTKANKDVDMTAQADEKKSEGNALLQKKKFSEAIDCYTEAIALSPHGPSSHVYYCNRAAARCHLHQYREAIVDCEESLRLNRSYVKAYSRLGLAHYFLKEFDESIAAYEEGLRLEPNNKSVKDSLEQAKTAKEKEQVTANKSSDNQAPSGMPDLSSLAGMMGGGGGMPDMSKLMQNPQMMSMAQEMMKNPQMMQQAMQMMQGMGGGGAGGMPDMSSLASMMGNLGGGGGGGSSGGNPIPDFSGFNDGK